MSLEEAINDNGNVVYVGIRKLPYLSTVTAWNSFDINLETPWGKNTTHRTHGIYYWNNVVGDSNIQTEVSLEKANRKRQFSKVFWTKTVWNWTKQKKNQIYNFIFG